MFEPRLDVAALDQPLRLLERARTDVAELDVPPILARWLARQSEVRRAHMSTRIEGNPLTEAQVRVTLAAPPTTPDAAQLENLDYRTASDLVRQVAGGPATEIDGGLIRALHFVCIRSTDRHGTAGQYRTEQNAVMSGRTVLYLPPHPSDVPSLMDDLVRWLRAQRAQLHPLVLAAVAHLEFVSVHPFDDGNGRTARLVTAYFLARGGWLLRDLVSSEEVFGTDIAAYYAALQAAQGDRYPGQRPDVTAWVRWFLGGLLAEAETTIGAVRTYPDTFAEVSAAYADEGEPGRLAHAMWPVVLFGEVTTAEYAAAAGVSRPTAVSDLNRLVRSGILHRVGRGPATRYVSAQPWTPVRRADLRS